MKINELVSENLKQLEFNQQMLFGISCVERCIDLYKHFDNMITNEGLQPLIVGKSGFNALNDILNFCYALIGKQAKDEQAKIHKYIKKCYKLAPHDEDYGDIQTSIAQFTANSLAYVLEFFVSKNFKYLKWCSDSVLEILNITESDRFYAVNPDSDADADAFLTLSFEKEIETQLAIILKIKQFNSLSDFRDYVNNCKLFYEN